MQTRLHCKREWRDDGRFAKTLSPIIRYFSLVASTVLRFHLGTVVFYHFIEALRFEIATHPFKSNFLK